MQSVFVEVGEQVNDTMISEKVNREESHVPNYCYVYFVATRSVSAASA